MRTIVVGDLHLKQSRVLPLVDEAMEQAGARRVVLCGDVTDDWGATDADALSELAQMALWVGELRLSGVRVDVLMGNHDFAYVGGPDTPGMRPWIRLEVQRLLYELGVVIATDIDDILATHAGLTEAWARSCLTWEPSTAEPAANQIARQLNKMLESGDRENFRRLGATGPARGGWGTPGPLWADATELAADYLPGLRQIVGHTPMTTCTRLLDDERHPDLPELWACDTFSTYRNGTPIGDGSLLLVDDNGRVSVVRTEYGAALTTVD
ncbi:MAG: metallophosphoesterase [Coriobacteriia bacterium]|nr:metallophosphoesterase [Coriobacteriia bacterium]MBS5477107.1 metallophosphoesterase [Coriobacteriia bacterium]